MNLSRELRHPEPKVSASPWPGHEHFVGYGVMVLPFSSGHLLGLRVFPENDFAPYTSVWHRAPEGDWSIYNDGPSLKTTCPRWWGPALERAGLEPIEVTWTGANDLRVEMETPRLEWDISMAASAAVRVLNLASSALPLWTWRPRPLLRIREWIADKLLGMGDVRFSFQAPHGQDAVIMPERIYTVASSRAILDGRDLGRPVLLPTVPKIGDVPLPRRAVFVVGQAYARIADLEEYRRTREHVAATG